MAIGGFSGVTLRIGYYIYWNSKTFAPIDTNNWTLIPYIDKNFHLANHVVSQFFVHNIREDLTHTLKMEV